MKAWVRKPTTQAGALVALAFALTLAIALLGGTADTLVLLLLTLLAGVFQFFGASRFHSAGRADPSLARASVRRLFSMAGRAYETRLSVEQCYETGTPGDAKKQLGVVSAQLSFIEEGAVQAIEDWREFHDEALADIEEKRDDRHED
ncbi:hypothetical protein GXB85_04095 [Cellulomonas sp. APG4]|uniref:hypothetical protein n=1 Tax=Cellulomonas sp. APG4 TaxID=1538656 RepID=UPI00137A5021|nr:hypothetical protein [Cellulomonas sp. APG4]NCT90136.1 hypothetical protein [Cellulomonas sp. APG4]